VQFSKDANSSSIFFTRLEGVKTRTLYSSISSSDSIFLFFSGSTAKGVVAVLIPKVVPVRLVVEVVAIGLSSTVAVVVARTGLYGPGSKGMVVILLPYLVPWGLGGVVGFVITSAGATELTVVVSIGATGWFTSVATVAGGVLISAASKSQS